MLNVLPMIFYRSVVEPKSVRCIARNVTISRKIFQITNPTDGVLQNISTMSLHCSPCAVTVTGIPLSHVFWESHRSFHKAAKEQKWCNHVIPLGDGRGGFCRGVLGAFATFGSPRFASKAMKPAKDEGGKKKGTIREQTQNFAEKVYKVFFRVLEQIIGFMFGLVYRGPGEQVPPIDNLLLLDSGTTLALKIRTKKVTSVEVCEAFIARIKEVNGVLNAVVDTRYEEALQEAAEADKLVHSEKYTEDELAQKYPFLGVPYTTKDCVAVKGLKHTAGLYKRKDLIAPEDADCILDMKAAGAIIIAVTNCSELCMWWETNNPIYGRTKNPYNTNRIVGGSSGGEGSIQGAAGSAIGIGADIGGSIRMPAYFNGIFGHKPSRGVTRNGGLYPNAYGEQMSYLTTGPIVRNAGDMLPVLKVLAGPETSEKLHLNDPLPDIRKIKVYYMEDDGGNRKISPVQSELKESIRRAVAHLDQAYGVTAEKVQIPRLKKAGDIWFAKMRVPEAPPFTQELANLEGNVNVYWELVKKIFCSSHHTFVALITAFTSTGGFKYGTERHSRYVEECSSLQKEFEDMLGDDGVFLYPVHPTVAPYHNEPIFKPYNFHYTSIWNVLGLPSTSVPMGLGRDGVPLGLQIIANLNQDRLNLAMSLELEKAFGGWVPPAVAV